MSAIERVLAQVKGVTFASVDYTTDIKTAAIHKHRRVTKRSFANVMLVGSIKDSTHIFERAVKKSAAKFNNSQTSVDNYTPAENWYEHTSVYSIVRHKTNGKQYLYALFNTRNKSKSEYFIDGQPATKSEVAELLTPSAARDLLNPPKSTVNKTHNIEHDVVVRVIGLDNIDQLKVKKSIVLN